MPYLVDPDHLGEVTEASQVLEQFAQHGIVISIVALKPFKELSGVSIRKKRLRNSTPLQTKYYSPLLLCGSRALCSPAKNVTKPKQAGEVPRFGSDHCRNNPGIRAHLSNQEHRRL